VQQQLLIGACAASAGIHAALVPHHLAEGLGPGLGFLAAAIVLAVVAIALTERTTESVRGAAVVLGGLLVVYVPDDDGAAAAPSGARAGDPARPRNEGDRGGRPARLSI
jgi:hypothetical protein